MIVNVAEYSSPITVAALELCLRMQRDPRGVDQVNPSEQFHHSLKGKIGEAAWAKLLELDVESVLLDDGPGRPDILTEHGWKLDSKATEAHSSYVGVRAEWLDKHDLEKWVILGSRVTVETWDAELLGSVSGKRIRHRQVEAAAEGHSASYVKLPLEVFDRACIERRAS